MIHGVINSEKYVYHYTSIEVAYNYILKDQTIKLGRYSLTNDPKEYRDWDFSIGTNRGKDLGTYHMGELSRWLSDALKQTTKLVCFATDTGPLNGDITHQDLYRRGFSKPRMWAQYGDRHRGVCLVFDKAALHKEILAQVPLGADVRSGKVNYVDAPLLRTFGAPDPYQINVDVLDDVGRTAYVALHLKTYGTHLFFEKSSDWRDECEYRWVVGTDDDDDLFVRFGDSLVGIMFGDDTPEKVVQDIMGITANRDLSFMGMKWRNSSPWYDMANLRYVTGIQNTAWAKQIKRL